MKKSRSRPARTNLAVLAAIGLLANLLVGLLPAGTAHASGCAAPHLDGSFIQPDRLDTWLSSGQVGDELDVLNNACIGQQIIQWTADTGKVSPDHPNGTTVYPTSLSGYQQTSANDVVGQTLTIADTADYEEFIGLQANDDWWKKFANDPTWLNNEASKSVALADELWAKYKSHRSFAGWYLSFEVENFDFTTQTTWDRMAGYYKTVADHLHSISGLPVIISPFFNTSGGLTPALWTDMWTSILHTAPIDAIALQDGVGAGHAVRGQLADWFSATQQATSASTNALRTQLWADSETFTPDSDIPNSEPMTIGSLVADMKEEQPYVTKFWSFSYDHYDSPLLFNHVYDDTWQDYIFSGTVETNAPSAPRSLTATATDAITTSLHWTGSTDDVGVAGYQVYRNGILVKTLFSTATSYIDTQLDPSTAYSYQVKAYDAAGNLSAASNTAPVTTPAGAANPVILSAGKPYTASLAADPTYSDTSGTELTDGTTGTTTYTDAPWQGRNTGDPFSFTIDLGSTKTVNEVDSDWLQVKSVAIFLPKQVTVETSANGTTFTNAGTMSSPAVDGTDQAHNYRLINLNVSARYVRVTATPASSAWSFTDEVKVRSAS